MPERVSARRYRFEAEAERKPLSGAQERRLRQVALDRAPKQLAEWLEARSEEDRFYAAPHASLAAFRLEREELAAKIANAALSLAPSFLENWNYGNAIHFGHTTRGLLALRQGNVSAAAEELLLSGRTPGSPQLGSFGPSMQLAKELLRTGERPAVQEYFQQCRQFWRMGSKWLTIWEHKVRRGEIPVFFMHVYR